MKRILNCRASDFKVQPLAEELVAAIKLSEGRTVLAEVAAEASPLYSDVTNAELVAAFGADLILLKGYNTKTHSLADIPAEGSYQKIKQLTGRLVGISLEVVSEADTQDPRHLTKESLLSVRDVDFLCLTGYDKPGVTRQRMLDAIVQARAFYPGFLMVAKFYGKGLAGAEEYAGYIGAGAHAVVIPAPGSCQGSREEVVSEAVRDIQLAGGLAMTTISSSQEGADMATVRTIGLASKRCGSDVHNFGDAGCAGIASPEAIQALSIAIRGKRHTYVRMASSLLR